MIHQTAPAQAAAVAAVVLRKVQEPATVFPLATPGCEAAAAVVLTAFPVPAAVEQVVAVALRTVQEPTAVAQLATLGGKQQ